MPTYAQKKAIKKYHDKQVGISIRTTPEEKKRIEELAGRYGESNKTFLLKSAEVRAAKDQPPQKCASDQPAEDQRMERENGPSE